jgi:predicted O-methyltransferase YrrM
MSSPTRQLWSAVDDYIAGQLAREDDVLQAVRGASERAGLPAVAVPANLGKLLELLVRITGARDVLEIGTLGGYSATWLARALPRDGRLVTLEANPGHAEVAQASIEKADLAGIAHVRAGPPLRSLERLVAEDAAPFDLIFIDADKQNNPAYLTWSLRLSRRGTVIVADNVVRAGAIIDPEGIDSKPGAGGVRSLRRFYELLASDPRVTATAIQTVGSKGHDGFALALVTGEPAEE